MVAETATAAPKISPPHQGPSSIRPISRTPASMQAATDPAMPSHDFLGLIDGAIGCLPNSTPAANPPTSLHTTVTMNAITRAAPSSGTSSRAAKPASSGT